MPVNPCIETLLNSYPELHKYLEGKAGVFEKSKRESWIKAAKELQHETLDNLHNIYNKIGVKGFEAVAGKVEVPETFPTKEELKNADQIVSTDDAESRLSNGERIFGWHEMDEQPYELTSVEEVRKHTPDLMVAIPRKTDPFAKPPSVEGSGEKGATLTQDEEARLKELHKKNFLKQEMTPSEQNEFINLKNKRVESQRKAQLGNQLEDVTNVNGELRRYDPESGMNKTGKAYQGENWEATISGKSNTLKISKRNPETGEWQVIHESNHPTEADAIKEYEKHNQGIEEEINSKFDSKLEQPKDIKQKQDSGEKKGASVILPEENKEPNIIPLKKEGETTTSEPPPPQQPIQGSASTKAYVQYPPTSLNYLGTGKLETEFGMEERTPTERKRDVYTIKEADDLIAGGLNVSKLSDDIINGEHNATDAEYVAMTKYAAELADRLRDTDRSSTEYNATLSELNKVATAANASGQEEGRALGIRGRFKTVPDGSYGDFMLHELNANNDAPLTDNQKTTADKEFTDLKQKEKSFEERYNDLKDQVAKDKANQVINKIRNSTPKTKKTHEDFINERKNILSHAREQLKKARGETSAIIIPYAKELFAIAPDVAKMVRSLAEEGIYKLADVIKTIHEQFKEEIPDLLQRDIHNIIAGEYNEKKITKKDAAIKAENLRIEAQLINKLENLQKGAVPKNEKQKVKRNQEIESLRNRIKDFKKDNPDYEGQLKALKNKNAKEAIAIKEKIAKGDFAPEEKKKPILQDGAVKTKFPELFKDAQKSRDNLIKAKREIELRRLKQMYENRSSKEKIRSQAVRLLNVPRTLMASMDFSAPLRQGIVASIAHPVTAAKAFKFMFKVTKDQAKFDRWFADVHESPRWEVAEKSGLAIMDPKSLHLQQKEEAFLGASVAEKIPGAGIIVKGSERAYVGFLNKMRWDLFNNYVEILEDRGKTMENSPELYKGYASFINNATGRGELGFAEAAGPVLNGLLFSPRLIASRFNMLGLGDLVSLGNGFYGKLPTEVRVKAMIDMLKFIAVGVSILGLAKYGFGADVEDDPRSSDFGKIRVGNTRWDIWGGFQPYVRLISQIVTGKKVSTTTGKVYDLNSNKRNAPTKSDAVTTFLRYKLAPVPALTWDLISGTTGNPKERIEYNVDLNKDNNEVSLLNEAYRHLVPLFGQDVAKAMEDQGVKGLFTTGIPSVFGVGVQTYSSPKK